MNNILKQYFLYFIFVACLILCFRFSGFIKNWFYENNYNRQLQKELIDNYELDETSSLESDNNFLVNPPSDKNDIYWNYIDYEFLNIDFESLSKKNNDMVGWIYINGTLVNYPVVQSNDNNYYLKHSFDKSYNEAGWIFLDYRNNYNILDFNTIIYGHNRRDNSMFGSLNNLLNKDWYNNKDNYIIKFSTNYEDMIFLIFSVYTIKKENYYITNNFNNNDNYQKFLDTIYNRSQVDINTNVNINDKIITLSTCLDNYDNRIVVHAKMIKKENK